MDKIFRVTNQFEEAHILSNEEIIEKIVENYKPGRNTLLYGSVQSGKTKNIIKLIDDFFTKDKLDVVFYVVGNTNELKKQNTKRLKHKFGEKYEIIDGEKSKLGKPLKHFINKKAVVVVLKQHIEEVADTIKLELEEMRSLIIDDESDDYSLSEKSIHAFRIINNAGAGVISCTATPFMNLYLKEFTYDDYLKLTPGAGYSGIGTFREKNIEIINLKNGYKPIFIKVIIEWAKKIIENRELFNKNAQLLFNISSENQGHDDYYDIIFEICEKIKHGTFDYETYNLFEIDKYSLEEIRKIISSALENGIKIANSKYKDKPEHQVKNEGYEIIIGGIYLSRGITYENLISEMMINVSSTSKAHTVIQRSRWCGYRFTKDDKWPYKKHIKIYFDEFAHEAYKEAIKLDEITKNYNLSNEKSYSEVADEVINAFSIIKVK